MMDLPVNYEELTQLERRCVREEYIRKQEGLCYHCGNPLDGFPTNEIEMLQVDRTLFPSGFFNHPIHLHHSHDTGMTIGVVHCRCNAVLWQYHGE